MLGLFNWVIGSVSGIVSSKKAVTPLVVACMIALFVMNGYNKDLASYELLYQESSRGFVEGLEPGYNLLCVLFYRFGFDYILFRNVMAICSIALLAASAWILSSRPALVLSVYCFAQFWLDITLSRNFFSLALSIWAISKYFTNKNGEFRYILQILIAASIHLSSIVFLLFIIAKRVQYCSVVTLSVIITAAVSFVAASNLANLFLMALLDSEEYAHYLTSRPFLGSILSATTSLLFIVTMQLINSDRRTDPKSRAIISQIACANMLALPLCILLFINSSEFFRLFKCILFLDYSAVALYLSNLDVHPANKKIACTMLILGALLVFAVLASSHPLDGSLVPILFNTY